MPEEKQARKSKSSRNWSKRLKRTLHSSHHKGYPEIDLKEHPLGEHDEQPFQAFCIDYGPDEIEEQEITDFNGFFDAPRPDWSVVRWIRVIGRPRPEYLKTLAERYHFHPLALEDLIQTPQRPKVDKYFDDPDHAYLAVIASSPDLVEHKMINQQVSIFASRELVVSFQEHSNDTFQRIRNRLKMKTAHVRSTQGDFLLYCILDEIVDRLFPILDQLGDRLEDLDEAVLESPSSEHMMSIHDVKREMMLLRREIWPMREMLLSLKMEHSDDDLIISKETSIYLRDVYDHCIHIADMLETYRDAITAILDIHMNMMSNRMNEVMKVLTIIATIFIPLSFLSGVFGMNFTKSLPGQNDPWSFTIFVACCAAIGLGMAGWFWWKKWF